MRTRFILPGFFLLSASLAVASPASQVPPADWVDRMIADHAVAAGVAAPASRTDVVGLADWVDRMVADRSLETAGTSSDMARTR